jgi:signal transduction histidine kinase
VECGKSVTIRDRTAAIHLYRIAQEAVTNAVKHARAKHIVIKLSEMNGEFMLCVTDDGIGIAPGAMHSGGLGLSIMNSRCETINGTLQIRRGDKGGTVVNCVFRGSPCPAGKPACSARRLARHNTRKGRHGKLARA